MKKLFIGIGIVFGLIFVISLTQYQNDLEQAQNETPEALFQRSINDQYEKLKKFVQKGQFEEAWGLVKKFERFNHANYKDLAEIRELVRGKYESQVRRQVRKLPASQALANYRAYKILVELDPKNPVYQKKFKFYAHRAAFLEKVDPHALQPYDRKNYPRIFSRYGKRIRDVEKFRKLAAKKALESGKCDFVEVAELSDKSPLNNLTYFVDCRNRERIYITENQIKHSLPVRSEKEKAWSKTAAIEECKKMVRARAFIPSEVDFHEFTGTAAIETPTTHRLLVQMDFEAKNALGQKIPFTARCIFPPGESGTIEITRRK